MSHDTDLEILCQKMREKRNETYAQLSSTREEIKAVQLKTRAKLLEDLLQEVAHIKRTKK